MPRVGGPPLVPLRGRAAVIPAVSLPPVAGPADGEHRATPAAPERAPPYGAGHRPLPGCRGRLVRGCWWNGGRAAISERATARVQGARTACAAPRRSGPKTGDLWDGRVSRSRSRSRTFQCPGPADRTGAQGRPTGRQLVLDEPSCVDLPPCTEGSLHHCWRSRASESRMDDGRPRRSTRTVSSSA